MNADLPAITVTFSDTGPTSLVTALDLSTPMHFAAMSDHVGVHPLVAAQIKLAADHILVLQTELRRRSLTDPALAALFVEANVGCEDTMRDILELHETFLAEQADEALAETDALRRQAAIDAVTGCVN
jgi:hypothetical protein